MRAPQNKKVFCVFVFRIRVFPGSERRKEDFFLGSVCGQEQSGNLLLRT